MRYRKILYFETTKDADGYTKAQKAHSAEKELFIALTPSVRAYFKKEGIDCETTLPYITDESHCKLSVKSQELCDWMDKNLHFADMGFGVITGYKNDIGRWMKFFVNYYLLLIEIISNSCDSYKPEILAAPQNGRKALSRQFVDTVKRLFIQPEERHMAALARRIAKKKGITFEDIAKGSRFRLSEWDFLKPTKNAVFLILFIALYLKQKLRTVIISAVMRCSKNPIVIFTSPVGYMKKLAYKLNASINANFYFLQRWVIPDVGASLFAKLFLKKFSGVLAMQERFSRQFCGKIREMHDLFSYRGITFTDILAEKFENDIAPYIMGLHMWTVELHGIVRRFKPSLVVSSGNRLDDSIIGELCRKINMPSIMVSHGSYVYPKNDIEIIEWGEDGKNYLRAPFSFVALQSPLDEDYTRFFPPSADAVKTGPLVWGGSVNTEKSKLTLENILGNGKKNPSKLKVILHASTQKPNNRLKFHIYETPDEYIQSLSELADAVRKIPETLLIVRFKPREDFSSDDLKSIIKFSDNIILSVREPFLDLLGMSNLLVSLSSTTITEALQNRIPVLLYGGRGRYRHIPSYEISGNIPVERRAVYHIAHEKDLRYGISGILNLGLDRNKDGDLFESYIYKEDERVSLVDLMNAGSKGTFK